MNIEFDRCIEFLTRMIEKYGKEIVASEEDSRCEAEKIDESNESENKNTILS